MPHLLCDVMSANVHKISREKTLMDAAKLMQQNDIGFLPVTDGQSVAGAVTDRDLVIRGYARGLSPDTPVSDVMTKSCVHADKSMPVCDAAKLMSEKQIRRLCVFDGDRLVGVCSLGDISTSQSGKEQAGDALSRISLPAQAAAGEQNFSPRGV